MFLMVHQALQAAGMDHDAIYRRFGYAAQQFEAGSQARTPHRLQAQFWTSAEDVSGDPDIGLHLCPHLPPYRGEVLEYLMFSSPTVGDGLQRVRRYLRLVSDALRLEVATPAAAVCLEFSACAQTEAPFRHTEICVARVLQCFLQELTDGECAPLRLELRWPPAGSADEAARIFGCPVRFDADANRLWWPQDLLERRSGRGDPALLQVHEAYAHQRLVALERRDWVAEVRRRIAGMLENGPPTLAAVARDLGVPPRRLRAELTQAGASFSAVVDELRFAIARRLLADGDERMDHIVYLTGFSEPSAFYRAFRRWSGQTPVAFRRQPRRGVADRD
jgi:AraC-type DNA-binding domain-containing proteins